MSIPHYLYDNPQISDAIDRAQCAVRAWRLDGTLEESEREKDHVLAGWSGVSLVEAIAVQILEAQGYDTDGLDEVSEADATNGWTLPVRAEIDSTSTPIYSNPIRVVAYNRAEVEK